MNILDRTKQSLIGHWSKGAISDDGESMCVMAHMINNANQDVSDYADGRNALLSVVVENYPERAQYEGVSSYVPVVRFNDHPDTTEDEVVAMLEKASAKYDEIFGE